MFKNHQFTPFRLNELKDRKMMKEFERQTLSLLEKEVAALYSNTSVSEGHTKLQHTIEERITKEGIIEQIEQLAAAQRNKELLKKEEVYRSILENPEESAQNLDATGLWDYIADHNFLELVSFHPKVFEAFLLSPKCVAPIELMMQRPNLYDIINTDMLLSIDASKLRPELIEFFYIFFGVYEEKQKLNKRKFLPTYCMYLMEYNRLQRIYRSFELYKNSNPCSLKRFYDSLLAKGCLTKTEKHFVRYLRKYLIYTY